jgi:hypothetical protein
LGAFKHDGGEGDKEGHGVTRSAYANGYSIFRWSTGAGLTEHCVTPMRKGHVRLSLRFAKPLPVAIIVLLYGRSPALMQIDQSRNVLI